MVPGTAMTFAGLPRGKERADVIAYLNSKSDKPVEFPKAAAAPAAEKQASGPAAAPKGDAKPEAAPAKPVQAPAAAPPAAAPEAPKAQ
jgi:cytochrome c